MTTIYTSREALERLPPRNPLDFYPTPLEVAKEALSYIPDNPKRVLDPGAGNGVWGQAARERWGNETFIAGVDIDKSRKPDAYDLWINENFLSYHSAVTYDCVIGNPPYKNAELFVRMGLSMIKDGEFQCFLLRLNFLEGKKRSRGLWRQFPPRWVIVKGRVSFTGDNRTNATAYAYFIWQKGWSGEPTIRWSQDN